MKGGKEKTNYNVDQEECLETKKQLIPQLGSEEEHSLYQKWLVQGERIHSLAMFRSLDQVSCKAVWIGILLGWMMVVERAD